MYGMAIKNVDVGFSDFSDLLVYFLILMSFIVGGCLYKSGFSYWSLSKLLELVTYFNFTLVTIQFLSPHIVDGKLVEFLISLYAPLDTVNKYYWRGTGTLGQAGQFGLAMVFVYSFFLSQYFVWKKIKPLIICLLIFISIVMSGTKAAIIECFIATVFIYIFTSKNNRMLSFKFVAVTSLIFSMLYIVPKSFEYFNYLSKSDGVKLSLVRDDPLSGMHHRNKTKLAAIDLVANESILFGFGPAKKYFEELGTLNDGILNLRNPDSSFSLIIIRYGFVGIFLSISFYGYLFYRSCSMFRKYRKFNEEISSLSMTFSSCLFSYFFAYWMDPILNMTSYIIWFYVCLGFLFAFNQGFKNKCRSQY